MKTIGLIGGMSWQSTALYYRWLNEGVNEQLGGSHSAKICMVSVDFGQMQALQHQGKWDESADVLIAAAKGLERAGADFFLICTNTMHKVAEKVQKEVGIKLLHIADATAKKLVDDNIKKVALLGTRFTMEQDFYKRRLIDTFGIDVIVPEEDDRKQIHQIIYEQLCQGIVLDESREKYINIIDKLANSGAEAVILGCTEITMLIKQNDINLKLYDTTQIHADAAIKASLD